MIDILESCRMNELIRIHPYFDHTSWSGVTGTYDSNDLSVAGYSPFDIWQNNLVAESSLICPMAIVSQYELITLMT
jgi:hypothetical protein